MVASFAVLPAGQRPTPYGGKPQKRLLRNHERPQKTMVCATAGQWPTPQNSSRQATIQTVSSTRFFRDQARKKWPLRGSTLKGNLLLLQSKHAPHDPISQQRDVEIDEESGLPSPQAQVGEKLGLV